MMCVFVVQTPAPETYAREMSRAVQILGDIGMYLHHLKTAEQKGEFDTLMAKFARDYEQMGNNGPVLMEDAHEPVAPVTPVAPVVLVHSPSLVQIGNRFVVPQGQTHIGDQTIPGSLIAQKRSVCTINVSGTSVSGASLNNNSRASTSTPVAVPVSMSVRNESVPSTATDEKNVANQSGCVPFVSAEVTADCEKTAREAEEKCQTIINTAEAVCVQQVTQAQEEWKKNPGSTEAERDAKITTARSEWQAKVQEIMSQRNLSAQESGAQLYRAQNAFEMAEYQAKNNHDLAVYREKNKCELAVYRAKKDRDIAVYRAKQDRDLTVSKAKAEAQNEGKRLEMEQALKIQIPRWQSMCSDGLVAKINESLNVVVNCDSGASAAATEQRITSAFGMEVKRIVDSFAGVWMVV